MQQTLNRRRVSNRHERSSSFSFTVFFFLASAPLDEKTRFLLPAIAMNTLGLNARLWTTKTYIACDVKPESYHVDDVRYDGGKPFNEVSCQAILEILAIGH